MDAELFNQKRRAGFQLYGETAKPSTGYDFTGIIRAVGDTASTVVTGITGAQVARYQSQAEIARAQSGTSVVPAVTGDIMKFLPFVAIGVGALVLFRKKR